MNIVVSIVLAAVMSSAALYAQPYIEGGETRHRFAQTLIGAGVQYIPGNGALVWDENGALQVPLSSVVAPVISIGGLHFWGHANFFIDIPLAAIATDADRPQGFSPGIATGAKIFPWRVTHGSVRPYLGVEWTLFSYSGGRYGNGPTLYQHKVIPEAGLVFSTPAGAFDAGVRFITSPIVDYPIAANDVRTITLPATVFSLMYSFAFETTLSAEPLAMSGRERIAEEYLAKQGRLDGITVGAGLSSAFTLTKTHAVGSSPVLHLPVPPAIFPEVTVGYYWHDLDAVLNLTYRSIGQEQEGYGIQQQWKRRAWTLEGIKFIGDYYGFAPFVGAMISREDTEYSEIASGWAVHESRKGWSAGVVLGWDIRPNRLQWFTVRTAVRYTPVFDIALPDNANASFDHLEANFFQLVVYPTRLF